MPGLLKRLLLWRKIRELNALERGGGAAMPDVRRRQRHADLTALVEGPAEAIPLYDGLARDFPEDRRHLFTAAEVRLEAGDPAGAEALERLAAEQPGLAAHCYELLYRHHGANRNKAEHDRLKALYWKAVGRADNAAARGRLIDPGGPVEQLNLDVDSLQRIRKRLRRIEGLSWVLAGERRLKKGGFRQFVVMFDAENLYSTEEYDAVCKAWEDIGDTTIWRSDDAWEELQERLMALPAGRLWPED